MTRQSKTIVSLLIALGLVTTYCFIRQHVETSGDRKAVASRLRALADNVRRNPNDTRSLQKIVAVLNGKWSFARTYACGVLGELGPLAQPAVPDLIRALDSGDRYVEREAARALGEVAIGMHEPVEPLRQKLVCEDIDVGYFSAEALGKIGEPALVALPDLERAAQSRHKSMSYDATEAVDRLRKLQAATSEP
jgi:HEAT repeat protein